MPRGRRIIMRLAPHSEHCWAHACARALTGACNRQPSPAKLVLPLTQVGAVCGQRFTGQCMQPLQRAQRARVTGARRGPSPGGRWAGGGPQLRLRAGGGSAGGGLGGSADPKAARQQVLAPRDVGRAIPGGRGWWPRGGRREVVRRGAALWRQALPRCTPRASCSWAAAPPSPDHRQGLHEMRMTHKAAPRRASHRQAPFLS